MDALPSGPPVNGAAAPGRWRDALGWAAVAALLLFQYGLFRQFAQREVVWAYPFNYDQIVFLGQSYDTYEQVLARGVYDGLKYGFYLRTPNGALLHLQAALLFLLLGASRLSALTLNFLYFALLQAALAGTLRWLTRRWSVALLGVGLLLAALTPFSYAGGVMDFRIDFIAFCLFGVFACAVLRSRVLLSRPWSLGVGAAAAWLVLNRTLTLVYLTGMAALLTLFFLARLWRGRRDPDVRRAEARRLAGLALAGAVLAAAAGPVLWDRREQLKAYYVVGHLTGIEKFIRAQKDGNPYLFYPESLLSDHAGPTFLKLAALALLVGAAARAVRAVRPNGAARLEMAPAFAFLAAAVVVPLAALTYDMHRSPCTGNVLLIGLLGLVLAGVVRLAGLHREGRGRPLLEGALVALAGVAVACGAGTQLGNYGSRGRMTRARYDVEQILALHDLLHRRCRECCWAAPVLSSTFNFDYTQHEAHRVLAYERHGTWLRTGQTLGGSIFALTDNEITQGARASDFLFLVATQTPSAYPADHCLQAALPQLRAFCEAEMERLGAFDIEGNEVTLYARPALRVGGVVEGWVTAEGLRLTGPGSVLRGRARVVLAGKIGFASFFLRQAPDVRAELSSGGHAARTVPARFEFSPDRQGYRVVVDVSGEEVPADAPVEVRLTFDGGAVLPVRGLRYNTRRLIVPAPEHTQVTRD
jgi:hypothetical protein